MTNTVSTNISRQKKSTDPRSSRGGAAARAFFYNREILVNGQDLLHDAPTSA